MSFVKSVRKGKVRSPLRLSFSLDDWMAIEGELSSEEKNLHNAGVALHSKLKFLWKVLEDLNLREYSADILRRSYVGLANRDARTYQGNLEEKFQDYLSNENLHMEAVLSAKVKGSMDGQERSVNDLAVTSVDGLHLPLRKSFEGSHGRDRVDLATVVQAALVGQMCSGLTSVWEDVLWRDWTVRTATDALSVEPSDQLDAQINAVSYARSDSLMMAFQVQGAAIWKKLSDEQRFGINRSRVRVLVSESKGKYDFGIEPVRLDPHFPIQSFSLRIAISEMYFNEIFEMELPKLPGVTAGLLLSVWEVLFSMSEAFFNEMEKCSEVRKVEELWAFAPVIQKSKIAQLLSEALSISLRLARTIVEFLTFSEDKSDELWARPLVEIERATVAPVFVCILGANPLRMIEKWMKNGGLELQARGPAFERQIRKEFADAMVGSRLLRDGGVHPHPYKIPGAKLDVGDVDVIIWFGSTVLIGEIKCNLFPAKGSEFFNYKSDLDRAASQVLRKAQALQENIDQFWNGTAKRTPPTETKVVPFVLTNLPLGVGLQIDGVPVVDRLILGRFLGDGFYERHVEFRAYKGMSGGVRFEFYSTAAQAETVLESYLKNPPQLQPFKDGLTSLENVIPKFAEEDIPWRIHDYQVDIQHADMENMRTEALSKDVA